ncbi:MAG TPA: Na+/melibiose symporter and related transporter [Firmicutes bacterium]|jgi:GPH family glycoside/pentoside/hexuronide:cation symporter|nr:Na+/melibiose symporter and related transporter [Bacillota bacterium]
MEVYHVKKPLSPALKTFYGIGDLGFSLMTSVGMYFQTYFLTDVAGFNLALVGLIITIPGIFDAVFAPVYGAIIDAVKPMKWGKYRSWLILTPPLVVVLMTMTYTKIGSDAVAAAIIIACTLLARPLFNIPWVANVALISVLANDPSERVLLSSRRAFWTNLSRVFFSYIGSPLALYFGAKTNPITGYAILQFLMATSMMIGYFIHFKMTEGYEEVTSDTKQSAAQTAPKAKEKTSLKDLLSNLFQNPPLMALLFADFGRYLAMFTMTACIAYYFTYVAENMALMPPFMLITALAGVAGSLATPILNKKLKTRGTSIIGLLLAGGLMLFAKFVGLQTYIFMAVCTLAQFFMGMLASTLVALYGDTVIYGEWKTGKNTAGFIMGLMNLPLKIGSLARGVIMTAALAGIGFVAGMEPTLALKQGILNIYVVMPGIGLVLAGLILLFAFRLTDARLKEMTEEIEARKTQVIVES